MQRVAATLTKGKVNQVWVRRLFHGATLIPISHSLSGKIQETFFYQFVLPPLFFLSLLLGILVILSYLIFFTTATCAEEQKSDLQYDLNLAMAKLDSIRVKGTHPFRLFWRKPLELSTLLSTRSNFCFVLFRCHLSRELGRVLLLFNSHTHLLRKNPRLSWVVLDRDIEA